MGVDSLVAVEMRSWFLKELGVDVPVMKILGGASIATLVEDVLHKLPIELLTRLDPEYKSKTAAPSEDGPSTPESGKVEPEVNGFTNGDHSSVTNGVNGVNGVNRHAEVQTNGHVNGHTNGYTNGVTNGHTNGLTNGHVNGKSNGVAHGESSGFTNGVNGTVLGEVNGITNGKTNGYVNGTSSVKVNGITNGSVIEKTEALVNVSAVEIDAYLSVLGEVATPNQAR